MNIPAHDPHVGQAFCSISKNSSLVIEPSLKAPTASNIDDREFPEQINQLSLGHLNKKIAGTFVLTAANNMPGVILSQLEYKIHHQTNEH